MCDEAKNPDDTKKKKSRGFRMMTVKSSTNDPENPYENPEEANKNSNLLSRISVPFKVCIGACKCCIGCFKAVQKFEKAIKTIIFIAGLIIIIGVLWYMIETYNWAQGQICWLQEQAQSLKIAKKSHFTTLRA